MDVNQSPKVSLLAEILGNLKFKFHQTHFFVEFFFFRDISTINELNNPELCDFQLSFFSGIPSLYLKESLSFNSRTKPIVCLNHGATRGFAQPLFD